MPTYRLKIRREEDGAAWRPWGVEERSDLTPHEEVTLIAEAADREAAERIVRGMAEARNREVRGTETTQHTAETREEHGMQETQQKAGIPAPGAAERTRVRPDDRITERVFWEERLDMASDLLVRFRKNRERIEAGEADEDCPNPKKAVEDLLMRRWSEAAQILRNRTSETYGGDPDWQGEVRTRAEHTLEWIRLETYR